MSTYVGSNEAARRLGVSTSTLYAYVSRGRITRRRSADGRTSLFDVGELERLAERSRRPTGPRPTIDVRISSSITSIGEDAVEVRGHDLCELARHRSFEAVCELLWTGALVDTPPAWPRPSADERQRLDSLATSALPPVARLAVAAHLLEAPPDRTIAVARDRNADAFSPARRLICNAPDVLGSPRRTGPIARRLAAAWITRPGDSAVRAIDTVLVLLADHELATSTLAVRVAASARASMSTSIAAGLATLDGPLHGAAAAEACGFLDECGARGIEEAIRRRRRLGEVLPGFGHKVYRDRDPRFETAMEAVRAAGDDGLADELVTCVARVLPKPPNIDLALAALIRCLELPTDAPLFAVARIAGWAAHHAEEFAEAPLRFRGVTS
ncbi:MAG: citrate/2-methylcitrate synthase [Ilumatobacter sp.]